MGADEKHAATYHGGEYTPATYRGVSHNPDTDLVRTVYAGVSPVPSYEDRETAFDRWLETVRAEAKAEAYKDAADALHAEARWQTDLLIRHGEYRFRHCANRMTEMENVMLARANQYKAEPLSCEKQG